MKILVAVKRVPDYQVKVKVQGDGSGIITDGVKWIVNPFDEIAVEEAIKLKEQGVATEVVVAGIGPADLATQLRYALAMGADSALHVTYGGAVDSDLAARILQVLTTRQPYQLVILGKQAIDSDANQTGQLLAARLGWPQACFASKVIVADGGVTVTREVDGGLETVSLPLPAVVTTDLRLNTPRYASLPNIMKAKKKPLEEISFESLGLDGKVKVNIKKLSLPPARKGGGKVADVGALVAALKEQAKVL